MGANPKGAPLPNREIYLFIHNVYANFFKDSLDYFSLHLNPRFQHRVVGTYDKAVEYITKVCQYDRETDKPQLPALILNPSGDFDLADANAGGRQLWRFPNLAPGMIKRIFDPVYQDANTEVNVGFIRMQGDIELIMLLNSFYEYCDMKMLFLQIFGGYERWIYPQFFTTFIIIPEEFVNYEYTNPYTGFHYKLDWESAGAYDKLVRTIAKNELVLPCNIKPIYKLTGFSDASTRYGGADNLADWRLSATVHYELEIPAYLVLKSDYLAANVDITITAGSIYSPYNNYEPPEFRIMKEVHKDWGLDETSNSTLIVDGTCTETTDAEELEYIFTGSWLYTIDQTSADSTTNVVIELPAKNTDSNELIVSSTYGEMTYKDHYYLDGGGNFLVIRRDTVDIQPGMIIQMYFYKRTN
jgi:hypothetical protein